MVGTNVREQICLVSLAMAAASIGASRAKAIHPRCTLAPITNDEFIDVRQLPPAGGVPEQPKEVIDALVTDNDIFICTSCGDELLSTDDFCVINKYADGSCRTWICKPCNAVRTRIARIRRNEPEAVKGFVHLDAEKKKELYKKAHTMFGAALTKYISEECEAVSKRTSCTKFKESGDYHLLSEVRKWKRFVEDPLALANLERHSEMMTCGTTGETYIYVPQYRFETEQEERHEEKKRRLMSGEAKLANPKGEKPKKIVAGDDLPRKTPVLPKSIVAKAICARCVCYPQCVCAASPTSHFSAAAAWQCGLNCGFLGPSIHASGQLHQCVDEGREGHQAHQRVCLRALAAGSHRVREGGGRVRRAQDDQGR